MFKLKMNLDRHGPRPLPNIFLLPGPHCFSFQSTFNNRDANHSRDASNGRDTNDRRVARNTAATYIPRLKITREKKSQTNISNARGGQANIVSKSVNCKSANPQILKTGSINSGPDAVVLKKFN
jgi:hypothetical protein